MARWIFFHAFVVVVDMRALLSLLLLAVAAPTAAQLRLPGLPNLPQLPTLPTPTPLPRGAENPLAAADLAGLRRATIDRLLQRHATVLERDPGGEPVVRGELLAQPSRDALRELMFAAGYTLVREQSLEGLDERWWIVRPPEGMPLAEALARLRRVDPAGRYDYQHLYTGSGAVDADAAASAPDAGSGAGSPSAPRVGLIDAGIEPRHAALQGAQVHAHGCGGRTLPSAHGTAVASLLVGRGATFRGAAPQAALWAADVYCDAPTGGSVESIAQALAWMSRERVAVVNISLVGPPNQLLERAVAALVARGHLLVAAVGNDGPAAPPLYPAAWPGVVGVTGTDGQRRVLAEAGRGPQVMFAAPGADMAAATVGPEPYATVRGTSFAAPLVAGLLAQRHVRPDPTAAALALDALGSAAIDLGAPGRDPVYGLGLVGESALADCCNRAGRKARRDSL
jgi:subtilisin family serine protease